MPKPEFIKPTFALTYELNPPRGPDAGSVLAHAQKVSRFVDAFNVTDNPMSSLRMAPGPLAAQIQADTKVPAIPHITGRDRNVLALQSDLLGFQFLGLRNVFALTGDPMKIGDHPEAKGVYELYANQLIELIRGLNEGRDAVGKEIRPPTRLSIGAAVTLTDARPEGPETFRKKLAAGVDFFQTQIILDPATLDDPRVRAYEADVPFLIGTVPVRNAKVLATLKAIPGVVVTERIEKRLASAKDFTAEANRVVLELRDAVKGRYAGLHVMPIHPQEDQIVSLLGQLRGSRDQPTLAKPIEEKR